MRVGILGVSLVWSLPVEAARILECLCAKRFLELKDVITIFIVFEIVSVDHSWTLFWSALAQRRSLELQTVTTILLVVRIIFAGQSLANSRGNLREDGFWSSKSSSRFSLPLRFSGLMAEEIGISVNKSKLVSLSRLCFLQNGGKASSIFIPKLPFISSDLELDA